MTEYNITNFDSLWDYSKPEDTEKKFKELLPQAEQSGDTAYRIELLTQIARTLGLQRKFEDAHKLLDDTEKMLTDKYPRARVRYYLERGRAYNSSNVFDKARECFLSAYDLALTSKEDNLAADAAHMMGIVEKGEQSLNWNRIAMDIAEKSKDEKAKGWLGSLYNNTGWTYHDMGDYEKAIELFEKYAFWSEERKLTSTYYIAKWCIAKMLRLLGKTEESLEKQMEILKATEKKEIKEDGYTYEEIGECLLLLNRAEESKKYFKDAYDLLSQDIWLQANEKERLDRLNTLSN